MNNLLLTLSLGVVFILIIHSAMRFLTSLSSIKTGLIALLITCIVYVPLLIIDWPSIDVFAIQFAIYGVTLYLLSILHGQANINTQREAAGEDVKRGWHWGPALIVGFFVVVVSVDSVFITIAQQGSDSLLKGLFIPEPKAGGGVSSYFPGIIEHNYHEKEDQYNQYQKRLDEQRQRGWEIKYGWATAPAANKPATFLLSLRDAKNKPITKANISGSFQRGNTSKQDQAVTMVETEAGLYKVDITLKYPGRWELLLKVTSPQGGYDLKATTDIAP